MIARFDYAHPHYTFDAPRGAGARCRRWTGRAALRSPAPTTASASTRTASPRACAAAAAGRPVRSRALRRAPCMHARAHAAGNVFRYPVCFYGPRPRRLPELDRRLRLFGYNRRTVRDVPRRRLPRRRPPGAQTRSAPTSARTASSRRRPVLLVTNLRARWATSSTRSASSTCYGADGALAASWPRWATPSASATRTCSSRRTRSPHGARRSTSTRRSSTSRRSSGWTRPTASLSEPGERSTRGSASSEDGGRAVLGRAHRPRRAAHRRALARALARYPLMSAGHRPHPLAGGEARDEGRSVFTASRGSPPARGRRAERSPPGPPRPRLAASCRVRAARHSLAASPSAPPCGRSA